MSSKKKGGGRGREGGFFVGWGHDGGVDIHIPPGGPSSPGDADVPPNHCWSYLSKLTLRVMRLMARSNWLTRDQIAQELNEPAGAKLDNLLTDLAERGFLESRAGKGYMLGLPEDVDPDEFRKQLVDWLDVQESQPKNK